MERHVSMGPSHMSVVSLSSSTEEPSQRSEFSPRLPSSRILLYVAGWCPKSEWMNDTIHGLEDLPSAPDTSKDQAQPLSGHATVACSVKTGVQTPNHMCVWGGGVRMHTGLIR